MSLSIWLDDSTAHLGIEEPNRWQFPGTVTNSSGVFSRVICLIKLKKSSILFLVKLRSFIARALSWLCSELLLILEGGVGPGRFTPVQALHTQPLCSSLLDKLQHSLSENFHPSQLLMAPGSSSLKLYLSWICRSLFYFFPTKKCSRKVEELCSNRDAESHQKILCPNPQPKA